MADEPNPPDRLRPVKFGADFWNRRRVGQIFGNGLPLAIITQYQQH